jgi:hypothetical protein
MFLLVKDIEVIFMFLTRVKKLFLCCCLLYNYCVFSSDHSCEAQLCPDSLSDIIKEFDPNKIIDVALKVTVIGENYIVEPKEVSDGLVYRCAGSKQEYIKAFPHLEYENIDCSFESRLAMLYGYLGISFLQNACLIGFDEAKFRLSQGGDPFLPGEYGSALSIMCVQAKDNWLEYISLIESLVLGGDEGEIDFKRLNYQEKDSKSSQGYRYSVDLPCWSLLGYSTEADDYERLCQQAVDEISGVEHSNIGVLLGFVAGERRKIAVIKNTLDASSFGKKRIDVTCYRTKLLHQYFDYLVRRYQLVLALAEKAGVPIKKDSFPDFSYTMQGKLSDGEKINLTQIHFHPHAHKDPLDEGIPFEEYKLQIVPPGPALSYSLLPHLESLFKEYKVNCQHMHEDSSDMQKRFKLIDTITLMHWWLCQLCLFQRGSAAIANIFMQVLFKVAGLESSGFKSGICIDLEAVFQPYESYRESIYDLFCVHPKAWKIKFEDS